MSHGLIRALVVEDDPLDATQVRRSLAPGSGPLRISVELVSTLAHALDRLDKQATDVVLLDLNLPDSEGVDTVRRVRERSANVPIVVLSGDEDDGTALAALRYGAQDYLGKLEVTTALLRRVVVYAAERASMERDRDVLRERLFRASKLESLGTLAGGLGHDFNNLLTVILLSAEGLRDDLREQPADRALLAVILEACELATRITRQLVASSGAAAGVLAPLDLSLTVHQIERLLVGVAPRNSRIGLQLDAELPWICGSTTEIQQLVLNLVVNGTEALKGEAGDVTVSTRAVMVDEDEAGELIPGTEFAAGPAVALDVTDTGCGMDRDTLSRIFEPFFSTKLCGRGLGLAAVLGIVRSHGAALRVRSRPGAGSTFRVYFRPLEEPL